MADHVAALVSLSAVDFAGEMRIGLSELSAAQRVELGRAEPVCEGGEGAAQSDTASDRPPVARLAFHQRLGRPRGRIELWMGGVVLDRYVADLGAHRDGARGVLALVLSELPLAREEPEGVGDACAQPGIEVGAGERLQREVQR